MDPNNEKAFELKGDVYRYYGLIDKAFIFYSKAIDINPESSSAMNNLAEVYHY